MDGMPHGGPQRSEGEMYPLGQEGTHRQSVHGGSGGQGGLPHKLRQAVGVPAKLLDDDEGQRDRDPAPREGGLETGTVTATDNAEGATGRKYTPKGRGPAHAVRARTRAETGAAKGVPRACPAVARGASAATPGLAAADRRGSLVAGASTTAAWRPTAHVEPNAARATVALSVSATRAACWASPSLPHSCTTSPSATSPDTLSLTLKWFPQVAPFFDITIWDRWPDQWSPNCALVLQSMVPALVQKSASLCNSAQCRELNVRGIVLGFGYNKYHWEWWYMPLKCRLQSLGLTALCDCHHVKRWVLEGVSLAEAMGRGGRCTHTHTHTQEPSQSFAVC